VSIVVALELFLADGNVPNNEEEDDEEEEEEEEEEE